MLTFLLEFSCFIALFKCLRDEQFAEVNTVETQIYVRNFLLILMTLFLLAVVLCLPRWMEQIIIYPHQIVKKRWVFTDAVVPIQEYKYVYFIYRSTEQQANSSDIPEVAFISKRKLCPTDYETVCNEPPFLDVVCVSINRKRLNFLLHSVAIDSEKFKKVYIIPTQKKYRRN